MPTTRQQVQRTHASEAGVRERVLDTACKLFYEQGIQAVGIQRLIDEAGIAKASLYAHFASKDELVAAYLERSSARWRALVEARLTNPRLGPRAKLLRIFDLFVEWVEGSEFRGCPFLNAAGEVADQRHPARTATAVHRDWWRGLIGGLVQEMGASSPDRVTAALLVLLDGAAATSLLDNDRGAARQARWAAERILDQS